MKREITPDLIKNIFCLYYGQKVLRITDDEIGDYRLVTMTSPFLHLYHNSKNKGAYKLELTALSDITDEDAIEVSKIFFGQEYSEGVVDRHINGDSVYVRVLKPNTTINQNVEILFYGDFRNMNGYGLFDTIDVIDYLRSKGYALPAHGFTVQELIDAGVYKIRSKE